MADMKEVYQASTSEQAEEALKKLSDKWKNQYPYMVKSWNTNWPRLSAFFRYPKEIRKLMYTTNIIESFHSQLRKVTKSKRVFSNDQSLIKLIYLVYEHKNKAGWVQYTAGTLSILNS
jgi:putative transposase